MKKLPRLAAIAAMLAALGGCVVAPAPAGYAYSPGYYYAPGYYAPGYYYAPAYPAYPPVSVGLGFGFGFGGGHHWR